MHGDPFSPGRYVLRLSLPDGYQIPMHWTPAAQYMTILSGEVQLTLATREASGGLQTFSAGDFIFIPARQAHAAQVRGETVIQLSGNGPLDVNLGTPK